MQQNRPTIQDFKKISDQILKRSIVYQLLGEEKYGYEFSIEDEIYIVKNGSFYLSHIDASGKKIILDSLSSGDIFGDLDFDSESKSIYQSLFIEPTTKSCYCEVGKIDKQHFKTILLKNPRFALFLLSSVSQRLRKLHSKVKSIAFADVETRVIEQMVNLSQKYGVEKNGTIRTGLRITHAKLAEMLGVARETVSETISNLKRKGILSQDSKKIFLLNKNLL